MSEPSRAGRPCNSELISGSGAPCQRAESCGDSQVLGSTRNKEHSSATTASAVFIPGTAVAQPGAPQPPHLCLGCFTWRGHPQGPSAQQQAGDGGVGEETGHALPLALCSRGAAQSCSAQSVGPEKQKQERSQGPQHHPALRARFPCMIYPGHRDQMSWEVKLVKQRCPLSLPQQYRNTW